MKAVVHRRFGTPDAVEYVEAPKPVPADDQVLIRVRAASVNAYDWGSIRGTPLLVRAILMGIRAPKEPRLGHDVAGVVEAIGKSATRFKPGDEVFGICIGAFAEYACAAETKLAIKPPNVAFEEAAASPIAGLTALQGLRDKGQLQAGQSALINGATGGVGTFAVQIAKALGAHVTGVCSPRNVDLVRSLGADRVIDYTRQDFTRDTQRYDMIFDVIGNHTFSACRKVLHPNGRYIAVGGGGHDGERFFRWLGRLAVERQLSRFVSQKLIFFVARVTPGDLEKLGELMSSGKVKPVIEKRYDLIEAREAIRHFAKEHPRGKIVITSEVMVPRSGAV